MVVDVDVGVDGLLRPQSPSRAALAAGDRPGAIAAGKRAIQLNPRLAVQASTDGDLAAIRGELQ